MGILSLDLFAHVPRAQFPPLRALRSLRPKLWACESDHENFFPVTQLSPVQTRAGNTRRTIMPSCHSHASRPSVLNRGPDRAPMLASTASLRPVPATTHSVRPDCLIASPLVRTGAIPDVPSDGIMGSLQTRHAASDPAGYGLAGCFCSHDMTLASFPL